MFWIWCKSRIVCHCVTIKVFVFSHDRELASDFNLWEGGSTYGSNSYGGGSNYSGRGGNHPYTVDENGEIEMPVLGRIKVGGKTRLEVADLIKYRLLSGEMLADPTVLVEYYDLSFYALGEIGHSGRITIPRVYGRSFLVKWASFLPRSIMARCVRAMPALSLASS